MGTPDSKVLRLQSEALAASGLECKDEHAHRAVTAMSISPAGDAVATGDEAGQVRVLGLPGFAFEENVHRASTGVRQLEHSKDGQHLFAVFEDSADVTMHAVPTSAFSEPQTLKGHGHFARSVAVDPQGVYVASSGADGALLIHKPNTMDAEMPPVYRQNKLMAQCAGKPANRLQAAWHPTGDVLAVPVHQDVQLLKRGTWAAMGSLKGVTNGGTGHCDDVSIVAFSPSGRYLASADVNGQVFVWDTDRSSGGLVNQGKRLNSALHSMHWHPTANVLTMVPRDSEVANWDAPIPASKPPPHEAAQAMVAPSPAKAAAVSPAAKSPAKQSTKEARKKMVDDEAEDGGSTDGGDETDEEGGDKEGEDEEEGEEDANLSAAQRYELKLRQLEQKYKSSAGDESRRRSTADSARSSPSVKLDALQAPFQSSATPWEDGRRLMGWNLTARMLAVDRTDYYKFEIEFEDVGSRTRPISFQDALKCEIAALGEHGAVLASPIRGDEPSQVMCKLFDTWDRQHWILPLPKGEEATVVAIGRLFVCVATDKLNLHVFSCAGMPIVTLGLPAPVVTMTMSPKDSLAIVYHTGSALVQGNGQALAMDLWDLPRKTKLMQNERLPLSANSTLKWLGFATNGMLLALDDNSQLRGLFHEWNDSWCPVADLTPAAPAPVVNVLDDGLALDVPEPDTVWLLGVYIRGCVRQAMVVHCKPPREYPLAHPKPVPSDVPLNLQMTHTEEAEQVAWRSSYNSFAMDKMMAGHVKSSPMAVPMTEDDPVQSDLKLKKNLVQLVKAAIEADDSMKALELLRLYGSGDSQVLEIGARVANQYRKTALLDRIQAMRKQAQQISVRSERATPALAPPRAAAPTPWASAAAKSPLVSGAKRKQWQAEPAAKASNDDEEYESSDEEMEAAQGGASDGDNGEAAAQSSDDGGEGDGDGASNGEQEDGAAAADAESGSESDDDPFSSAAKPKAKPKAQKKKKKKKKKAAAPRRAKPAFPLASVTPASVVGGSGKAAPKKKRKGGVTANPFASSMMPAKAEAQQKQQKQKNSTLGFKPTAKA